jgi:hypothetical protein
MCAYCWDKVPKDLRRALDRTLNGNSRRAGLMREAIAAAQGDGT